MKNNTEQSICDGADCCIGFLIGSTELGPGSGAEPLPCLNSNISIERSSFAPLSTQQRKSAHVLKTSIQMLSDRFGIQYLGFLTLTFSDNVTSPKEAQRRLNSLLSNIIKQRYKEYVGVMERQKSGRIHYHLLIVLSLDIRSGFDFKAVSTRDYSSANSNLRKEWSFWRLTAKKYGFGRTELMPVRTNIEAMAKYVGKYVSKHVQARLPEDKGVRLVRYSKGARAGTTRFMFNTAGAAEWRRKVATFAEIVKSHHPDEQISNLSDLTRVLGKRWAYYHRDYILELP